MSVDEQRKVYSRAECPRRTLGLGLETHRGILFLFPASLKEPTGSTHHKSLTQKLGTEAWHIFQQPLVHSERSYSAADHLV